jgi:hypothetical protein
MPDGCIERTRGFFAVRAATWDTKFDDDIPVYTAAISQADIRRGSTAIDVGCGTGRAALAARHGHTVSPDEILSPDPPAVTGERRCRKWRRTSRR